MDYYHYSGDLRTALVARSIEQHPDYRVLRRLPRHEELWFSPVANGGAGTTIAIVDVETTGLDPDRDAMIELAVVLMRIDGAGDLLDLTPPVSMLEEPPHAIPPEVEALTGITDAMVAGRRFRSAPLRRLLRCADVLVSHHAAFDRAFLTQRFPWVRQPWACTLNDLAWSRFGLEGRALGHLLASAGHFPAQGHRAGADTWALACLLARIADDRRTIAAHLVEAARAPTQRLHAVGAPDSTRNVLKAAGYRWHVTKRAWWIDGDDEKLAGEQVFLRSLHPTILPVIEKIDWFTRHAR